MRIGRKKKSCWLVVWVLLEHSKRQCKSKVMGSSFATQFFKFVLFQSLQESTLVLHKLLLDLRDPRRRDVTANSVQRTVFFLAMIIRHKRSTRKRPLSAYKLSIFSTSFPWRPVYVQTSNFCNLLGFSLTNALVQKLAWWQIKLVKENLLVCNRLKSNIKVLTNELI